MHGYMDVILRDLKVKLINFLRIKFVVFGFDSLCYLVTNISRNIFKHLPSKLRCLPKQPYGLTTQNTTIWTHAAVNTLLHDSFRKLISPPTNTHTIAVCYALARLVQWDSWLQAVNHRITNSCRSHRSQGLRRRCSLAGISGSNPGSLSLVSVVCCHTLRVGMTTRPEQSY